MSTQITKNTFEKFYDDTYKSVLKYTICHCNNLEDVNDIIQDIYTELYHKISKRNLILENVEAYVIGIARKKLKVHYSFVSKKIMSEISGNIDDSNDSNIDIESNLITKDNVEQIWKYIRKKNEITAKIFYLFFVMDLPIKTIANDMKMTESSVQNHLYRTQKELKKYLRKEKLNNAG